MSVDDRLREAFGETDRTWDDQVPTALAELVARQRRETVVRRGTGAALVAAAAVSVVAVTVSQRTDDTPSPSHEPTSPTSTPSGLGAQPNPLDGTWVSEALTRADVRRAAGLAGDRGDAAAMLADLPSPPFRIVLYVNADRSSIHSAFRAAGRPEENADEENLTVTEDRVVMQPMFGDAEGENVHTFVIEDGTLRLTFVSTTEGVDGGIPAEAWQRLIYDSAPFTPGE